MDNKARLSKSRFLSGSQCHLRLWYDFNDRELAPEPSETQYAIFSAGHEVGELACERYPGGHLIAQDHFHFDDALEETKAVLEDSKIPAVYEAAFEFEGLIARVDVIERLPEGGWRLIEVKSTVNLKDVHKIDLAFQLHIARNAGLDVREAGVLTLNRDYVYDGEFLDLDELFKFHVLEVDEEQTRSIQDQASAMQEMVAEEQAPEIEPGDHCTTPYICPYYAHCTRDLDVPDHSIDELPHLLPVRRQELIERNILEIREIPRGFRLNKTQRIVRRSVYEDRELVNRKKLAAIDEIERPIRHLDFETFATAIPRFAGTSPYEALPFLFSVHTEREDSSPLHTDYLHERHDDPRHKLADELINALGDCGAICTYTNYERRVIASLIKAVPDRAPELNAICERLFDLCQVVRGSYYHPDFRGSFSLKAVFPVLCPDFGYEDLDVADGQLAAVEYLNALKVECENQRDQIFKNLRDYCERDTLATLKVRQALLSRI